MARTRIGLALAIAWIAGLTISYVIAQGLVSGKSGIALVLIALDVLAAAVLVILGGAVGTVLMPDFPRLSALTCDSLRAVIGLGVISILILIIGLLGLFPPRWLAWIITLGLIVLLRRPAWEWVLQMRDSLAITLAFHTDLFTLWLRRAVIFMLGLSLVLALVPPTAWDALTYHLAGPQHNLEVGRIDAFADNHFLGFPQVAEMLYLYAMLLARPQAATLLHWSFGLLLVFMILGFTRYLGRAAVGWLAVAILFVGLSFWGEFAWPYNDMVTAACITGAAMMLISAAAMGESHRAPYFLWAGVLTGMAMGTKYTAASAALGIAALVVWISLHKGWQAVSRSLAIVSGTALLVFLPWLLKDTILYQNPLAPFAWGTSGFDKLDQWYYLRPGSGMGIRELLMLPIQATVFGHEGASPYQASIGPLLIGFLPLPLIGWKRRSEEDRKVITSLFVLVVSAYLVWVFGAANTQFTVQSRLLYPVFPSVALTGAFGLDGLNNVPQSAKFAGLIRGLMLVLMVLTVAGALVEFAEINPLPVALGVQTEDSYLIDHLGTHYVAMQEVRKLPANVRVLTLWEPRTYYCGERCIPDSMIDQWWHDREVYGDPKKILEHWQDKGYTHLLVFESGEQFLYKDEPYDPLDDQDIAALDELRTYLTELWHDPVGSYTLYSLPGNTP